MKALLKSRGACLLLVGALSLAAHLKGATAPLLDYHFHRQVNTAAIARNYWRENRPFLKPRIDWEGPEDKLGGTEFPGYMWLYGRLWPLFGLGEVWGRLISIAASLATALLLFGLFELELGREAALWGAGLFSLVPVEVYFGRTVQPEAVALCALVGALILWERALRPGRSWAAWAGATFCAFLATGLKLPYAHVFIPLAGLTWRRLGPKALRDWRMYLAGVVSAAGVVAWYVYAKSGTYVVPTKGGEFLILLNYKHLPYFMQFQLFSRIPELVLTYGGGVLFFFGARQKLGRERDPFWLCWLLGVVGHLIALSGYAHYHEYTALPLAPVAAGLMGLGAAILREKAAAVRVAKRRRWALAGVALLLASVPAHTALRIPHWYRQGYEYTARAAEAASSLGGRDDLYFTNCPASSVLLYYLDRRGWSYELDRFTESIDQTLKEASDNGAVWLATEKKGLFAEPDGALWRRFRAAGPPAWDDGKLAIFPMPAPTYAPAKERLCAKKDCATRDLPFAAPKRGAVLAFGSFLSPTAAWYRLDLDKGTLARVETTARGRRRAKVVSRRELKLSPRERSKLTLLLNKLWASQDATPSSTATDVTWSLWLLDGRDKRHDFAPGRPSGAAAELETALDAALEKAAR